MVLVCVYWILGFLVPASVYIVYPTGERGGGGGGGGRGTTLGLSMSGTSLRRACRMRLKNCSERTKKHPAHCCIT